MALALAGVVSVAAADVESHAAPGSLNNSYRMQITDDPVNNTMCSFEWSGMCFGAMVNYEYLTYPGFDVFMYNNGYNGVFGDEHMSGITLTHHGERIAGNGDIHLLPVPEQWDAAAPATSAPIAANPAFPRDLDRATNTITLPMRYTYNANTSPQRIMEYDLIAVPEPGGVVLKVILQNDLPGELAGSAAFNLEFIPSLFMRKSYQVDTNGDGSYDGFSTFPLAPEDPMDEDWPRPTLIGNAWYVDQWNTEKGDDQPRAFARGYKFNLAPEDDEVHVSVESKNLLSIYDGRNRSQNGWFTMSQTIPTGSKAGETVAEWHIQAPVQRNWVRPTSIAHSQAGYAPGLSKVAVMEIDSNEANPPAQAMLKRLNPNGEYTTVFTDNIGPGRQWARYTYRDFDFSSVTEPGLYVIEYNGVVTEPFPIDNDAYSQTWQSGLSGFLATAMDHIEVREGYKIWHGASHMDDGRISEPYPGSVVDPGSNQIPWFDGKNVPMTLPAILTSQGYGMGDRIPGINQGGWYDAGDFDIEISRNYSVLRDLVYNAEAFNNMDNYDTLAVEWDEDTGGSVEMHRPDSVPDIVQQVKHGAMAILGLYENVGFASGSIEVPTLRQYTHLGDGSTDTDGFIYDPNLGPNDVVERIDPADGKLKVYSGVNDDRMLMSAGGATADSNMGAVSVGLAGAAYVTKDHYPDFAADCLTAAKEIWTDHGAWAMSTPAQYSAAFNTLVQLMLATQGTPDFAFYKSEMDSLLAQALPGDNPFTTILPIAVPGGGWPPTMDPYNYAAVYIMDMMDQTYRDNVIDAINANAPALYAPDPTKPFGLPDSLSASWGPGDWIGLPNGQSAAILYNTVGSQLSQATQTSITDYVMRLTNYIVGTHPDNDTSWLVGMGANSHKYPYNSTRADNGFIPGSIVPGYVNFRPNFPESLDNFQFLWAENEAIIDYSSRFIAIGLAADKIAKAAAPSPAEPALNEFVGDYDWSVQEVEAGVDWMTGQPNPPYETLTSPGLDVFMYNSTFSPIFGDQHSAGVELVLNGERVATNGDIHLLPTPEQWDATPPPTLNGRASDPATNTVSATLTLPGVTGDATRPAVEYTMSAVPEPGGVKVTVTLDQPLPADLAGKAGFNMEFIPDLYKEKGYMADSDGSGGYDNFGIIPLLPFDDMEDKDRARTDDQAWYVREWNLDRGDAQPVPIASGKTITLAPDTSNRVRITSDHADVQLLDGRNRAQNGWFVMRTLFEPGATEVVWHIAADVDTSWKREPNIGHSQAGYGPKQDKVAVIELDPRFAAPSTASVERINPDGTYSTVYTGPLGAAKSWLRYSYRNFDFSSVKTPGMYAIKYAGKRTALFPIADDVYAKSWQQALTGFLAKEMDHIAVRETYKIVHAASHMDDAILYPLLGEGFRNEAEWDGTWFDGQEFYQTSRDYAGNSLDRVPGQAVGGWYDAGDYDLEATRQAGVIQDLAIAWREFHPQYDTLDVDWDTNIDGSVKTDGVVGGMVELHRSDGVPDLVQQVKHGALNVLARIDAVGYNYKVVEVPTLRQYTHLGDGSQETDNLRWDPSLNPGEVEGLRSGKQDDRLAMIGAKDPALQFNAAYALAAANTVVKGYDNAFANRALAAAENIWATEDLVFSMDDLNLDPSDFMGMFMAMGVFAAEFNAAIELLLATGDQQYADAIEALWPLVRGSGGFGPSFSSAGWKASLVLDHMSDAFKAEFNRAIVEFKAGYDASVAANPWGMPDSIGMWGGSTDIVDVGVKMYFLHKVDPQTIPVDYSLDAATYIFGTHPDNDVSWLSGVGTSSIEHAYGNTRAEDTYVAGGIIPGYVPIAPDLPEAKPGFGMMWFESEYVIDTSAKWVILGNAINELMDEEPPAVIPPVTPPDTLETDRTILSTVIAGLAGLAQAEYSEASWAVYAAALANAQSVLANTSATAAQVQAAQAQLQAALSALRAPAPADDSSQAALSAARVMLSGAISAVASLNQADYTAGSWQGFASALANARSVAADPSATLAAIQSAESRLALAAGLLQATGADASSLEAAIGQANALVAALAGLNQADYSPEAWAALQVALTNARTVLGDANSTATQVAAAQQAVLNALALLTPQPAPGAAPGAVAKVKASQTALRVVKGKSVKLPAIAYTSDGAKAKVAWSSSNSKVASVNSAGKITAKKVGTAKITAKAGGKSAGISVTVVAKKASAAVKKVSASVPKTMTAGQVAWVTGKYSPARATAVKVSYSSSAPAIASIDKVGRLEAKAAGSATITVKAGKITKKYKVTVG
jgi:hypothetical protein